MNAFDRSAFACATVTPGFRRTIVAIHPQVYVVHQLTLFAPRNPVPAA